METLSVGTKYKHRTTGQIGTIVSITGSWIEFYLERRKMTIYISSHVIYRSYSEY